MKLKDSIKDGLIIISAMVKLFYVLKMAKVQLPKTALNMEDVIKLSGEGKNRYTAKDYAVSCKWI